MKARSELDLETRRLGIRVDIEDETFGFEGTGTVAELAVSTELEYGESYVEVGRFALIAMFEVGI